MQYTALKPIDLFQNKWTQTQQQLKMHEPKGRPQATLPASTAQQPIVLLLNGDEPLHFVHFAARVSSYFKTQLLLVNLYSFSYQLHHQFARLAAYRKAIIKMLGIMPISIKAEEIRSPEEVIQYINSLNGKMVIYRTTPFQSLENKLFGCPIGKMSEQISTHQLIVPSTFQQQDFSNILLALPNNMMNDQSIKMTLNLARASHSQLLATHVCLNENIKDEKEKMYQEILKSFHAWNQGVQKYDWELLVTINNSLRKGLKQVIQKKKTDLVVLSKKPQSWLTRFWATPQYKYLIKQSICPVLVHHSS